MNIYYYYCYYYYYYYYHHHHYFIPSPKEVYQKIALFSIALFSPGFHTNNKIITIMKPKGKEQCLFKNIFIPGF